MNYWQLAVFSLMGAFIGWLVGFSFERTINALKEPDKKHGAWETVTRSLAFGLFGAVVGAWGTLAFTVNSQVTTIESRLIEANQRQTNLEEWITRLGQYSEARNRIARMEDSGSRTLFEGGLDRIDTQLDGIAEGRMYVYRESILANWEELLRGATSYYLATNVVTPPDWKNVARDATGEDLQQEVINRGVLGVRIMLKDSGCPGHDRIEELAKAHRAAGVFVYELPREWIRQNDFLGEIADRLRTDDLVLVDGRVLLKTRVDEKCEMRSAEISVDPNEIAQAKRFFKKLLSDAYSESQESAERQAYQTIIDTVFKEE